MTKNYVEKSELDAQNVLLANGFTPSTATSMQRRLLHQNESKQVSLLTTSCAIARRDVSVEFLPTAPLDDAVAS